MQQLPSKVVETGKVETDPVRPLRKRWHPLQKSPNYVDQWISVSRSKFRFGRDKSHIQIRHITRKPALGNGVWSKFARKVL